MKHIFTFLLALFTFSGLFAQDCTVSISVSANPTSAGSFTFKTTPQTDGAKYYWSFGDNTVSDMVSPTHIFKITDTYSVQVKVTGPDGKICYGTLKQRFEVGTVIPTPIVLTGKGKVAKAISTNACGLSITMENGTILIPVEVVPTFEFKDGQYVEIAYEIHQEKPSGCTTGISVKIVRIAEIVQTTPCKVQITFEKKNTTPVSYTFKTAPQADGTKFYWSFGDNTFSDMASPTHTYKVANTYSVQLKVTSKEGQVCYGELKGNFEGTPATPVLLTGVGKVKKTTATDGCGLLITLQNSSVLVPIETIPAFEFKDGQYVELTYELLKDKPSGCSSGVAAKIHKISEIVPTATCKIPITFTKSSTSPITYMFKSDAQPAGTKYSWTFGDGSTSDMASPTHTFKVSNTYLINLKVVDPAGKICYGEIKVAFEGLTNPSLSGRGKVKKLTSLGCDLAIVLDNGSALIPYKMTTDFQIKEGQYVEFTYEQYAEKASTCKEGTDVKILTIKEIVTTPACKAYFTTANQTATDPAIIKKVVFANQSTGEIKECLWNFGDNTTSTDLRPTHEYKEFGEYKVCLAITTVSGCKSDYCATVKVTNPVITPSCKFDLVIKPKDGAPNTFLFSTVSQAEIKTWKWAFGDGKTSDMKNPEHQYEKSGEYQVYCVITTAAGCTETKTVKQSVIAQTLPNCSGAISLLLFDPTPNNCNGKAIVKLLDEKGVEIQNVKYLWSDNSTGGTVEKLCPDKAYSVQATVEGVCQKSYSFTFLSKPIWRATTINGQNNFAVVAPKDGIQYEWDFGNGVTLKGAEVSYNFDNNGVYDVKLKAASGSNFSESSQQVVVMNSVIGTDIINKSEILIYPNPIKDMLRINFGNPVNGDLTLDILNITGKLAFTQKLTTNGFSQAAINIQQLKSGIYFLRISNGETQIFQHKIIKDN